MGFFGKDENDAAPQQPGPAPVKAQVASGRRPTETTLICKASRVEGKLSGTADMLIEGELDGAANGSGRLMIAESGTATADLHARVVVVAGTVRGNVTADERIELQPTATLTGNITAPRIQIQEGATFEGEVRMAPPGQPSAEKQAGPGKVDEEKNKSAPPTSSARRKG